MAVTERRRPAARTRWPARMISAAVAPLVHAGKHCVAPRFKAHIDHVEPARRKRFQFVLCFRSDACGRSITGDAAAAGQARINVGKNRKLLLRLSHKRVAIGQKHAGKGVRPRPCCDLIHIRTNVREGADVELLFLIHTAKRAAVLAAADGGLQD